MSGEGTEENALILRSICSTSCHLALHVVYMFTYFTCRHRSVGLKPRAVHTLRKIVAHDVISTAETHK